jgi:hypothetical protein
MSPVYIGYRLDLENGTNTDTAASTYCGTDAACEDLRAHAATVALVTAPEQRK